jgi:hypothetical protein
LLVDREQLEPLSKHFLKKAKRVFGKLREPSSWGIVTSAMPVAIVRWIRRICSELRWAVVCPGSDAGWCLPVG